MNIRRLKALIKKENLQIMRDPSSILIVCILPLILLFLMGYAVSLDLREIKLGIISKSESSYARTLTEAFRGSKYFTLTEGKDKTLFMDMLHEGKIKSVIEISDDFGRDESYKIQLLIDATNPNVAGFINKYVSSIVSDWAKQNSIVSSYGTKIESRYWFNPPITSRYFLVPGSIVIIMTMIGTLLTSLVIAREWERGTMEVMMSTPSSMSEIIIGKIIPYFVLAMGSLVMCFLVAYFWYEIPFRGSLFILFLMGAIYLFPSLTTGLLISVVTKNQFLAAQISLVASFLPAFLLSGFLFEIQNMPIAIQILTYVIPARYFVNSIQTLFLAGNVYEIFLASLTGILIIGTILFVLVLLNSRKGLR
ncbi:MAG: ABC transporter permease [Campylobacteraceae bacterium]|jgi:ABC-2 type transport system permease protein|nr:ABC transporter permease [Campylobacteraceae bacterium]